MYMYEHVDLWFVSCQMDTNFMTILWQERERDFKIDIIFITMDLWN